MAFFTRFYENSKQLIGHDTAIVPGKEIPVIGDGNCAFRGIIQSLLLECLADDRKRSELIKKLQKLYVESKGEACSDRITREKPELNINDDEFSLFIQSYKNSSLSKEYFDSFFMNYFPTEYDEIDNRKTYRQPKLDNVIRFLALCLRMQLVKFLIAEKSKISGPAEQDFNILLQRKDENQDFELSNTHVNNFFKSIGINLNVHNDPIRAVLHEYITEHSDDLLKATLHVSGTFNENGGTTNGHFSVALFKNSYNKIIQHFDTKEDKLQNTNNSGIFSKIWKGFKKIFYKVANKLFDIFDELYDFFAHRPYDVKDENTRVALKDPVKHESDADVFCEELNVENTYKVNTKFEAKAGETPRFNIHVLSFDDLNEQENEENIEFLYRYIYGDSRVNGDKALDMSEENVRDIYRTMQRGQQEKHINKVFIAIDKNTGDKIGLISFGRVTLEVEREPTEFHRLVEPDIIIPRYFHGKLIESELAIWAHRYLENFASPIYSGKCYFADSGYVKKDPYNSLFFRHMKRKRGELFDLANESIQYAESYIPILSRLDKV